jgi:hypothetical protein
LSSRVDGVLSSGQAELVDQPQTQFTKTSDGVHIAYQVLGDGPIDIVIAPAVFSHVEMSWDIPQEARFRRRLATFARLILFDSAAPGCRTT